MKKTCFPGFIYEYTRTSLICTHAREDIGNGRVNEHFVDQNFISFSVICFHLFAVIHHYTVAFIYLDTAATLVKVSFE